MLDRENLDPSLTLPRLAVACVPPAISWLRGSVRAGRSPAMKFLTTAAIALVAATTAQAAEIKRIGGDISITGMITPGDAAKFKAIAANIGGTVILNSPGGYVAEAALISIQIRSQSYATRVPRRAKCDSACALIWVAGIRRKLDPRAVGRRP